MDSSAYWNISLETLWSVIMLSDVAKKNLSKDRNVLGKKWASTYGGWFSDPENISHFIDAALPHLPSHPLDVLYVASASGLLGEELIRQLGEGHLTLVDVSKKHLAENKNRHTKKVCADLLTVDLGRKYDLILMRSSLDYFPSADLQIDVLRNIKEHLKPKGLFVNQPAYIGVPSERAVMSQIYQETEKIGDRYFQSNDLKVLYRQAGFRSIKKIGDGKPMVLTEKDHIERYGVTKKEIEKIQEMIPKRARSMCVTKRGYKLTFQFPIFAAS